MSLALATVRSGGNVLIPVDTAGRMLEVLLRLDAVWDDAYPLLFVNVVGPNTVRVRVLVMSCGWGRVGHGHVLWVGQSGSWSCGWGRVGHGHVLWVGQSGSWSCLVGGAQ